MLCVTTQTSRDSGGYSRFNDAAGSSQWFQYSCRVDHPRDRESQQPNQTSGWKRDLFAKLSTCMRSSAINPIQLTNIISKTHLISKFISTSTNNGYSPLYNFLLALLPRDLNLRAVYSLTKVCLTCNTYAHSETVEKFSHKIESVDGAVPSFEFGLKLSLDSNEFCDKPDCFGSLRIFRVLKKMPSLLTFEFENMTTSQLPLHLKPCLIFESPSSTDLTLTCMTLFPPASLFYHTRLKMWIYLDSLSITPISNYAQVQTLNLRVILAFYTKFELPPLHIEPRVMVTTLMPLIPNPPTHHHPSTPNTPPTNQDARIYENWPLDNDSGQGSEINSSLNEPVQEIVETKYATIKRKMKKGIPCPMSVSVPDLRHVFDMKKVSFDCQVTLVDEGEEEYIPHPILQRVLAQMKLT